MATPIWYNFLLTCIKPLYRWRVKKRSGHLDDYQAEIVERFGEFQPIHNKHAIWFHAVSVGETNAAQALIEHYLKKGQAVLVTNTTRTGQARAKTLFAQKYPHLFQAVFLPIDQMGLIERFVELNQPKIVLLMETELWPNLLHVLQIKNIKVLLLNARLSEKSAKGYAKFKSLTAPMFAQLTAVAAQDEATACRFKTLGAQNIEILGNVKFDMTVPQGFLEQAKTLKEQWHLDSRKVIVLASTHAPEEKDLITALDAVFQAHSDLLCIIAPRHPERFSEVYDLIMDAKLSVKRRSLGQKVDDTTQIFLADSMGEMWLWLGLADVAYVGGSLNEPGGGHNILEPIAANVPTVLGKNYFNFQTIVDEFLAHNAVSVVDNADEAVRTIERLLINDQQRIDMNKQAQYILSSNQGALGRHIECIERYLIQ